jgi:hypothetical protein
LDSFGNAMDRINWSFTIVGTIALVCLWSALQALIKRYPVEFGRYTVTRLTYLPKCAVLGILVLLWTPPIAGWFRATNVAGVEKSNDVRKVQRPDLRLTAHQTHTTLSPLFNATQVVIDLEITNAGEPTTTKCWWFEYHAPGPDPPVAIQAALEGQPVYIPMGKADGPGAPSLEFDPNKSINLTTTVNPITRGVPVRGRLLLLIQGDRKAEFKGGAGRIKLSIRDQLQNRESTLEFQALNEDYPLSWHAGDKVVLMPKLELPTKPGGFFMTRPIHR